MCKDDWWNNRARGQRAAPCNSEGFNRFVCLSAMVVCTIIDWN